MLVRGMDEWNELHADGQGVHHQGRHRVRPASAAAGAPAARRGSPPRHRRERTPSGSRRHAIHARRLRRVADQEDETEPVLLVPQPLLLAAGRRSRGTVRLAN